MNGIEVYKLVWDSTQMVGNYNLGLNSTIITVKGYYQNKYGEFNISIPVKPQVPLNKPY